MSSPEIAFYGHAELITPNLAKSVSFFRDIIGLEEVERTGKSVYLRAWGDWEHHTLVLTEGPEAVLDHIAWKVKRRDDVDAFARLLKQAGVQVETVEAGREKGQGKAIRFDIGSGHCFELYYEMERAAAEKERRSYLRNQPMRAFSRGVSPRRIDHVNINVPNPPETHRWLSDHLGFKMREYIQLDNGFVPAGWMSVTSQVHDIAVMYDAEKRANRLHHIAYFADNFHEVLRAADIVRDAGVSIDVGPGKHGITQACFLYLKDPGSGHRIEIFSGGYQIYDPDWQPIVWSEKELAESIIWWGPALPPTFLDDSTGPSVASKTLEELPGFQKPVSVG
jgi:catechol 2,3-dioxygenase